MCAYLQHVAQEECKSLEEFSGIPVAKLRENDPSAIELKFSNKGFGDAEACVLGSVLQVRRKYSIRQPQCYQTCFCCICCHSSTIPPLPQPLQPKTQAYFINVVANFPREASMCFESG